jgi:Tripartite ATP-independent periplasmic transporters, DctQ component.
VAQGAGSRSHRFHFCIPGRFCQALLRLYDEDFRYHPDFAHHAHPHGLGLPAGVCRHCAGSPARGVHACSLPAGRR